MDTAKANFVTGGPVERLCRNPAAMSAFSERTAFYALSGVILLAAIPNGTVEVWQKAAVISAIATTALIRVVASVAGGFFRIAEPSLLAPVLGVLLLAVLQCVPSPFTGRTLSLDPYETRAFILVFGSLIVCGEVLFAYVKSVSRLNVMAALVIVVAVVSSVFGALWEAFAQSGTNILALYIRPHQGYAQFINRNHFAVLVEMALGLLIGLLLRAPLSERQRFVGWLISGGLIYSLIAAGSRGGVVSLAGLIVFAVCLHAFVKRPGQSQRIGGAYLKRKLTRHGTLTRFIAAAGICVLSVSLIVFMVAFVGGDRLASRFERVDTEIATPAAGRTNRNLIWVSTLDMAAANPVLGVGFGAYEAAITGYDRSNGKAALKQAHSEYLEILANGGVIGSLLFLWFAVVVLIRIKRNLASPDQMRAAQTFGATVGIFGVLVHSLVDFGLHVMVNALVFVVLIVVASANVEGFGKPARSGRKLME